MTDTVTTPAVESAPVKQGLSKGKKIGIGVAAGLVALIGISAVSGGSTPAPTATTPVPTVTESAAPQAPAASEAPAVEAPVVETPEAPVVEAPAEKQMTVSQENAMESAASYLAYSGFSKSGLIGQLKYEGFTKAQALQAVKSVGL